MARSKQDQLGKIRNKSRRNKDVEIHLVTRQDVADLLSSIGKPGKNRKEKIETVAELKMTNPQGVGLEEDLPSYSEF